MEDHSKIENSEEEKKYSRNNKMQSKNRKIVSKLSRNY